MDLTLRYGADTLLVTLAVWREGRHDPLHEMLAQIDQRLATELTATGWLVIFDRRQEAKPLLERTTASLITTPARRPIRLIRG
jgi:hypothetical protein